MATKQAIARKIQERSGIIKQRDHAHYILTITFNNGTTLATSPMSLSEIDFFKDAFNRGPLGPTAIDSDVRVAC